MATLESIAKSSFNTQQDQWEISLKAELKVEELKGKTTKRNLDVGEWSTLTLSGPSKHLGSSTAWKKAAQTYHSYPSNLAECLKDDLAHGVRAFFFSRRALSAQNEKTISETLSQYPKANEVECYYLEDILSGRDVHESGGNTSQELAEVLVRVIDSLDGVGEFHVGVFVDARFFSSIAKVRAMKLLLKKVQQVSGHNRTVKLIALNSYREFTLFERYSNVLRNNAQVAAGLIGGADAIQSSGYETLFEIEAKTSAEHFDRSRRIARNTSHILALESMLGMVEDAAYGSFHLESLTEKFASEAWTLMQKLLPMSLSDRSKELESLSQKVAGTRLSQLNTRRFTMAGTNDYALAQEKLELNHTQTKFFRTARAFEDLRLKAQSMKLPEVEIILKGDYAALSSRVNFIKNYFELMGFIVHDPTSKKAHSDKNIIVLCAKDEDYSALVTETSSIPAKLRFVAGKVDVPEHKSIFAGQDIYQVLSELVEGLA